MCGQLHFIAIHEDQLVLSADRVSSYLRGVHGEKGGECNGGGSQEDRDSAICAKVINI